MTSTILAPAAVLVAWSMLMLFWMVATRLPAFARAGIDMTKADPGARYVEVESQLPDRVNWKSHNYTHLMEQPTLFYAVVAILAIAGDASGVSLAAAWGYTGLRIAHSLWQGLVNIVKIRIVLFTLSTLCLWVLAINAVRITLL